MKLAYKLTAGLFIASLLTACVDETQIAAPLLPNAADQTCLSAISQKTGNSEVSLMSSEFSEAGTLVKVGVGPDKAPWQCIAYQDGSTDGIMSLADEGAL